MSGEERQRIVRRAGSNEPAEAEEHEHARASHDAEARERAARRDEGDPPDTEEQTPLAEEPGDPPRPRR